ncbi:MAG TPA: VWA domain-containing protein, partial [Gaiellaceae bacterium]|nr:VWA domain-containing protein [Gaiellaceae bacterium]
ERLRELLRALARTRPRRRSRRLRADRRGDVLDLRRLARASLATGGDPAELRFRRRASAPRRLVVLCDISGSMEPYARAILLFAHALLQAGRGVEAFVFGTRLTRVTPALAHRDPDRALGATSAGALDWAGGTRIGASLRAFNDGWGARGAVVVVVSDGLEIGDTSAVARETARLRRESYALLWLNPLKGRPDYEPLAGGMRAALPHVDRFLPAHDFESLEQLADAVAGVGARHRV